VNYASEKYTKKITKSIDVAKKMLSMLPARTRKKYSTGVGPDILAEILTAHARDTIAVDENGYDLADNTEVKYALYKMYANNVWKACIGNLNSKRGLEAELCVILGFVDYRGVKGVSFRYFSFPSEAWEKNMNRNDFDFSLESNQWKWYLDYEVTEKEYFRGKRKAGKPNKSPSVVEAFKGLEAHFLED
jgi:hypothetical protein